MSNNPYPLEEMDDNDDDGTMPSNVAALEDEIVGHKIVGAEVSNAIPGRWGYGHDKGLILYLDDGRSVTLADTNDCCAYTELEDFVLHPEMVDHVITGVGTTDGYETWHIFADAGDVMELSLGWSCGNPFYYGYGFAIQVIGPTGDTRQVTE